jgi:hypothetical protein
MSDSRPAFAMMQCRMSGIVGRALNAVWSLRLTILLSYH